MDFKRIIVALAVLVNAACASARPKVDKKNVADLASWIEATGRDRTDYNGEAARLFDRKPGDGRSKARGAPGKEGEPYRYIHLFRNGSKPEFLLLRKGNIIGDHDEHVIYKVMKNGKVSKALLFTSRLDSSGNPIDESVESKKLRLDKALQAAANAEIAFWLERMKNDALGSSAPRAVTPETKQ